MPRIINTDGTTRPMIPPQDFALLTAGAGIGITIFLIADKIFDFKNKFGKDSVVIPIMYAGCFFSGIGISILFSARISAIGTRLLS